MLSLTPVVPISRTVSTSVKAATPTTVAPATPVSVALPTRSPSAPTTTIALPSYAVILVASAGGVAVDVTVNPDIVVQLTTKNPESDTEVVKPGTSYSMRLSPGQSLYARATGSGHIAVSAVSTLAVAAPVSRTVLPLVTPAAAPAARVPAATATPVATTTPMTSTAPSVTVTVPQTTSGKGTLDPAVDAAAMAALLASLHTQSSPDSVDASAIPGGPSATADYVDPATGQHICPDNCWWDEASQDCACQPYGPPLPDTDKKIDPLVYSPPPGLLVDRGGYPAGSVARWNTTRNVWSIYFPKSTIAGLGMFSDGQCIYGNCLGDDAVTKEDQASLALLPYPDPYPSPPEGTAKGAEVPGTQDVPPTDPKTGAPIPNVGTETDKAFYQKWWFWVGLGGAAAAGVGAYFLLRKKPSGPVSGAKHQMKTGSEWVVYLTSKKDPEHWNSRGTMRISADKTLLIFPASQGIPEGGEYGRKLVWRGHAETSNYGIVRARREMAQSGVTVSGARRL